MCFLYVRFLAGRSGLRVVVAAAQADEGLQLAGQVVLLLVVMSWLICECVLRVCSLLCLPLDSRANYCTPEIAHL